jgi:hypothetical protein
MDDVSDAVADKNDVDAGLVDDPRGRIIVGRQGHKLFAPILGTANRRQINLFGLIGL